MGNFSRTALRMLLSYLDGTQRWVYTKSSRPGPGLLIYFDWTVGQCMRIYNGVCPFLKVTHAQIPLSLHECSEVEKTPGQGWMEKQVPCVLYTRLGKWWPEMLHLTSQCSQGFGYSDNRQRRHPGIALVPGQPEGLFCPTTQRCVLQNPFVWRTWLFHLKQSQEEWTRTGIRNLTEKWLWKCEIRMDQKPCF